MAHEIRAMAVVFCPQLGTSSTTASLLVSGGCDELIKVWDGQTGDCSQTLRAAGPYAGMDITGATGISEAQRAALKTLGAIET
jgi:hypothetical protein